MTLLFAKISPDLLPDGQEGKTKEESQTTSKLGDQRRPRVHQLLRCYNLVVMTIIALPGGKSVFTVSADTAHKEKT